MEETTEIQVIFWKFEKKLLSFEVDICLLYICYLPAGRSVLRPWAAFSRLRSQFFTIRTDPKPVNNIYIINKYLLQKTVISFKILK